MPVILGNTLSAVGVPGIGGPSQVQGSIGSGGAIMFAQAKTGPDSSSIESPQERRERLAEEAAARAAALANAKDDVL